MVATRRSTRLGSSKVQQEDDQNDKNDKNDQNDQNHAAQSNDQSALTDDDFQAPLPFISRRRTRQDSLHSNPKRNRTTRSSTKDTLAADTLDTPVAAQVSDPVADDLSESMKLVLESIDDSQAEEEEEEENEEDDDDEDEEGDDYYIEEEEEDEEFLADPEVEDEAEPIVPVDLEDTVEPDAPVVTVVRARRNARNRARPAQPRMRWADKINARLSSHHPDLDSVWDSLQEAKTIPVVPVDQPAELSLELLPFQKYGVGWMIQQEKLNDFKGGILADEMGMGKTIQTIALLLSDKKKPNLVIAPTVALIQWKREIETHTNNALSVNIFHGTTKLDNIKSLQEYDVVLTTYSTMENSFRRQEFGSRRKGELVKEKSIIHKIHWHRIILDEAHNIKDRSCNTARAVFNLNSNFKWSLSGTPLQNRVGELYSLIRFMQADPFGYYFCTKCPCKSITWRFTDRRSCDECGHKPMDHLCWWNNEVLKPIQRDGHGEEGRVAMKKLRLLLDKMMLRRTKLECADDLGLPPRTVVVRRDMFNEEEEDVYKSLFTDSVRKFTTYVEQGSVLNNYANIFELLMKMRQSANHPDLITKKKDNSNNKQLVCMLCNEPPEDAIVAACKHVFCRECCAQYYQSFDYSSEVRPNCPTCFATLSVDLGQPSIELPDTERDGMYSKTSIVNRIDMSKWRSSTKIEALVEELTKLKRQDKTIKSIVFSQFVNFLDLVYWRLSRAGFECIRLDGSMSPRQRDAAINCFMTKPTVTVFLISLKAGGVALNLTEASRVFICDPWWNPAAELQAMDRIHRLGQHRPIKITRLIIENSIESRIVQLQEKKQALVESTIGNDTSALERLSVEDLRFLFVL